MAINIIDITLETLKPYLNNQEFTDLSIRQEGAVWCKHFGGEWKEINDESITKIYLQDLFRLIAIEGNKEIEDIDNFRADLDINCDNETHRANVIFGKSKKKGFGITIRLKRNHEIFLDDFVMTKEIKEKIIQLVKDEKNILISGGIGTGKTTFLNSLLKFVDNKRSKRIVAVENATEINLSEFPNKYPFIYENNNPATVLDVFNDCLRSSPDMLLLGEIRKENAKPFLNFINDGHDGTISTVHASSPKGAFLTIANYITSLYSNENKKEVIEELKANIACVIQLKKTYQDNNAKVAVSAIEYFEEELLL